MIVDRNGATLSWSAGLSGSLRSECESALDSRRKRAGSLSSQTPFERLKTGKILRIVALAGEHSSAFAIFVEDGNGRNPLAKATRQFDLTLRESAVLGFMIDGFTTADIAKALLIKPGTVGDHVDKLFKKTKTKARGELLALVTSANDIRVRRRGTPIVDSLTTPSRKGVRSAATKPE